MLFIFFSLLFSMQDAKAIDKVCACPAKVPLAKSSCGVLAKNSKSDIFLNAESCTAWSSNLEHSIKSIEDITTALKSKTDMKSPDEVLDYMSCYADRNFNPDPYHLTKAKEPLQNLFCHFKTTLAPQIAWAAESSGLPFSVQACLYFRESGFFSEAKSPKGAVGYVQFMPETVNLMSSIVKQTKNFLEDKIAENQTLKLAAQEQLLKTTSVNLRSVIKKNIIYYETLAVNFKAQLAAKLVWDKYWVDSKPPLIINSASVKCPQVAFALSVMKQTYDLNFLVGTFADKVNFTHPEKSALSINQMGEQDSAIFLSGAYNAGAAGLASTCGGTKKLEDCIKKLPKSSETRNYMSSIRSCSSKNSTAPMTGNTQKKCEDYLCHLLK